MYDKRKQFLKSPEYDKDTPRVGKLQCVKADEDGYCDWCEQSFQVKDLWYSTLSYTHMCNWCREIRELELQIDGIARDRVAKNNIKKNAHEMYPYTPSINYSHTDTERDN